MTIIDKINSLKSLIVSEVNKKLNEELNELGELYSYEIVWKQFETAAAEVIKSILESEIPNAVIEIPKSKSKYPDIKIIVDNNKYAIDIKCAEIQKDPWYDMARLDTFVDSRINVYKEEWELLIQYDSEYKKFKKVFFGLFKDFVGYDQRCNGVKYRPYDGKIRPKSWNDI